MPRQTGPEREHFGGEDGLCTEICRGKTRYFWKCNHCDWVLGGKNFQNCKVRIHLSGDPSLRNGIVSAVCPRAPENVKQQFTLLTHTKRMEKRLRSQKRKRSLELLNNSPVTKQTRLRVTAETLVDEDVDDSWGEAFFGLDIVSFKIGHPLFREAIAATKRSKTGYVNCPVCVFAFTSTDTLIYCRFP